MNVACQEILTFRIAFFSIIGALGLLATVLGMIDSREARRHAEAMTALDAEFMAYDDAHKVTH